MYTGIPPGIGAMTMAKSARLQALRGTAAMIADKHNATVATKQTMTPTGAIVPTGVVHEDKAATLITNNAGNAPLSAQTHESRATYYARMAVAPMMPDGLDQEQANAWYAGLTDQQRAAYDFEQESHEDLDHAATLPTMSLRWKFMLEAVYTVPDKDNPGKTICLLDEWPMPDTKDGNNPAIKEEQGFTKTGKPTTKNKVDFYNVIPHQLKEGKVLRKDIESLQAVNPKSKADPNLVKPEHKQLTPHQAVDLLNAANARWNRFKGNIKEALKIRFQMAAIKSLKNVGCDYVYQIEYDAEGNEIGKHVTNASTPFKVWDIGDDTDKYPYTIKNFLALDVEWSRKNGGTLKALLKGEPKAPTQPKSDVKPITWSTFDATLAEMAAYLGRNVNSAGLMTRACATPNSDDGLSDETVVSLWTVLIALTTVEEQTKVRYAAIKAKQREKEKVDEQKQIEAVGGGSLNVA